MIKRFAQCLREYKWTALVSPVCMIGEVAMEVTIPLVMADLYDYGIAMSNMTVVWQKALQLLLCALASLLFGCLSADYASKAATGFARNLRHDMYYRVQDFSAAEDLTQDTFVSAYRNLEQFDDSYEKAWLCRIAANKCTDYLKSAKRRSEPVDWDEMQDLPAEDTGPEQETYEALVREQLLQRCRQLKPPYDQIAELYFYREESPEAAAAKILCTTGAVTSSGMS